MKYNIFQKENPMSQYLSNGSWRIKENANHIFCVGHMMNYISAVTVKDFWMNNIFTKKDRYYHQIGRIHAHDLSRACPYCSGFSTSEVIEHGIPGPNGRISSSPPKHMSSLINQLINFVGVLSQEFAGAIALNDFAIYLAPYVRHDGLNYNKVKQEMQQFVFHLNQPSRWAGESPFSNVTVNLTVPADLKNKKVRIGDRELETTYGDYEKEMQMIVEALLDVLIEGDSNGTPMTFPVLTVGITDDFPWESEIARKIFQVTAKYGTPFFENFKSGTGRDPSDSRSLCCRLRLDANEIKKHSGGIFGNADSMGSISVVTLNLNRIGFEAKTKEDYYRMIDDYMDVAKNISERRREYINLMYKNGLYPYTSKYLKNYKNYFSTIGVIGGNESMINFMGKNMSEPEAIAFMEEVIDHMNERAKQFQKETGNMYNVEAVPGEGCAHSLARKDKEIYGDKIYTSGRPEVPYLTNSTMAPVNEMNFVKLIKNQESLQTKYTGGTTINIYLGERLANYKQARSLVQSIIKNTNIPYFSLTPIYSICKEHGYIAGETYRCPTCNKSCEVFSRVVGYLKPRQNFNDGKAEEFRDRKYFDISDIEQLEK